MLNQSIRRPLKQVIPFVEDIWKKEEIFKSLEFPRLLTEIFYLADFGLAMKVGDQVIQQSRPELNILTLILREVEQWYGLQNTQLCLPSNVLFL